MNELIQFATENNLEEFEVHQKSECRSVSITISFLLGGKRYSLQQVLSLVDMRCAIGGPEHFLKHQIDLIIQKLRRVVK